MITARSRLGEVTAQSRLGHSSVTARSQLNHGIFSMITAQSILQTQNVFRWLLQMSSDDMSTPFQVIHGLVIQVMAWYRHAKRQYHSIAYIDRCHYALIRFILIIFYFDLFILLKNKPLWWSRYNLITPWVIPCNLSLFYYCTWEDYFVL